MPRNRIIAILTATTGALCLVVGVSAKEPDYPCYMTTATGRVVNLGLFCGDTAAPAVTVQPVKNPSKLRQNSIVKFTGLRVQRDETGGSYAFGQISNLSESVIVVAEIAGLSREGVPVSIGFVDEVIEPGETLGFHQAPTVAAADASGSLKDVKYWVDKAGTKHYNGFTVCSAAASVSCRSH